MLNYDRAVRAADRSRQLRRRGVTIRKVADVTIASYCLDEGLELLTTDRDFEPYRTHFGLAITDLASG